MQEIKLSAQMSRGDLDHTVKVEAREEESEKKTIGAEGQGSGKTFKRQNEWSTKWV